MDYGKLSQDEFDAIVTGELTPERIQRLDDLDFVWKVNNTDG
jgi:hypothetical protein